MSAQSNCNHDFNLEITNLLKSIAIEHDLQNYNIKKNTGAIKGDGFLGVITAVEMSEVSDSDTKILNLIVKSALKGDAIRSQMPITDLYQREIYMYNTVIPSLQQFLIDRCLPPFPSFAKCYKTTMVTNNETLILENLKSRNFKQWERRLPMNKEHFSMIIKEYGRLHGISFAIKDQDPVRFENLTKSMDDNGSKLFAIPDFMKLILKEFDKAAEVFDLSENSDIQKAFKNFINGVPEFAKSLAKLPTDYSVILHGDCWTNNFLFKYDEATNTPTEMCFIDLQMSRLGPPVLDVAHFFYACSSKSILDNYQHYLDLYYTSLAEYVKTLGSNPDEVYPRSVFLQQWKQFAKYGMIVFIMVIKTLLSEDNEVADFCNLAESGKSFSNLLDYNLHNSEEYRERVKNIVLHFYENKFF